MTMEQLIEAIKEKQSRIRTHECLLDEIGKKERANISMNGSWSVAVDHDVAWNIVNDQLNRLVTELGRLQEAKKAGEITMEGWLNASAGGSNEPR